MAISIDESAKKVCILSNWTITNLKLQKVLYISQVAFLGKNNSLLLNGEFEAWDYGPVLPELYHKVKRFGANRIKDIFYNVEEIKNTEEASFLEEACKCLLNKQAFQLVEITHRTNGAWAKAYKRRHINPIIAEEDMSEEYKVINEG